MSHARIEPTREHVTPAPAAWADPARVSTSVSDGKAVKTRPCKNCGKATEVAGTSVWWGKGRWAALNGDTSDRPALLAQMTAGDDSEEEDDDDDEDMEGYMYGGPYS